MTEKNGNNNPKNKNVEDDPIKNLTKTIEALVVQLMEANTARTKSSGPEGDAQDEKAKALRGFGVRDTSGNSQRSLQSRHQQMQNAMRSTINAQVRVQNRPDDLLVQKIKTRANAIDTFQLVNPISRTYINKKKDALRRQLRNVENLTFENKEQKELYEKMLEDALDHLKDVDV